MENSTGGHGRFYRDQKWWREETFLSDLYRQADRQPNKIALVGRRLHDARMDTLTYDDLAQLTTRFAGALLDLGVGRGDVVACQFPNRWELAPLLFACMRIGAVMCPITPDCPPDELRHRLALTEAAVYITTGELDEAAVRALHSELPVRHVLVSDTPVPAGALSFYDKFVAVAWENSYAGELSDTCLDADEPFVVLFTSGTTGESKGVLHSQNTVYAAVRGYAHALALSEDLVAVVTTPLVHYSGLGQGILTTVMLGATIIFHDRVCNRRYLDSIERFKATLVYGPQPTISDIVAAQQETARDVSSLRKVVAGAMPVLEQLVTQVHEALEADVYSIWGMSEFGPVTVTPLEYDPYWAARSHGRPIGSVEIRIDSGSDPLESAVMGRLLVRGASQAIGYHKRAEKFAAKFTPDGWFDTGDMARADGRGGIRIIGRAQDMIVRDGEALPIAELEALISQHSKVSEAAITAVAGDSGEVIVAVVVPSADVAPTREEIQEQLRSAGYDTRFYPERVEVLSSLPKTTTGKVRKVELRERFGPQG